MCDLLKAFPGWEAIKVTRGHYRSCGKDPHACCVSDLLSDQAVVRSGRDQNYASGKDTGNFWDAGASNVHWAIVTDAQVEQGIREALARVIAPGVFVEGNSILDFIQADFVLMVARTTGGTIKSSARRALSHSSAIYLSSLTKEEVGERSTFAIWAEQAGIKKLIENLPTFTQADLPELVAQLRLKFLSDEPETLPPPAPPSKTVALR